MASEIAGSDQRQVASSRGVGESGSRDDTQGARSAAESPTGGTQHEAKSALPESRRRFLTRLSFALGGIGAAAVGVPVIAFLIEPLFRKKPRLWQAVGNVDQFQIGMTTRVAFDDPAAVSWTGVSARTAAWLRRDGQDQFTAFAVYCSHLGCPVNWLPDANLFLCPCHGGVYYKDGTVAGGPPPRPLTKYPVRVNNGQVEIQTSPIPVA